MGLFNKKQLTPQQIEQRLYRIKKYTMMVVLAMSLGTAFYYLYLSLSNIPKLVERGNGYAKEYLEQVEKERADKMKELMEQDRRGK